MMKSLFLFSAHPTPPLLPSPHLRKLLRLRASYSSASTSTSSPLRPGRRSARPASLGKSSLYARPSLLDMERDRAARRADVDALLVSLAVDPGELAGLELPVTVDVMRERVEFLRSLGLEPEDLVAYPLALGCSVRKNMVPILDCLGKLGVCRDELPELLRRYSQVQKRSNKICLHLYEKELLTDTSYLRIYRLQEHELDAEQLAVVCALHKWRDYIACEQDESTGYVLPNKALIEIAKKMPTTTADLQRIVKSKYPFIEDNFDVILGIIWNATKNSDVFEEIAEQVKKEQLDRKSVLATGEVIKMAPMDADNVGSNFDPPNQYYVAPPSTAKISVSSNSRCSFMSEAKILLQDKTQSILSDLIGPY